MRNAGKCWQNSGKYGKKILEKRQLQSTLRVFFFSRVENEKIAEENCEKHTKHIIRYKIWAFNYNSLEKSLIILNFCTNTC